METTAAVLSLMDLFNYHTFIFRRREGKTLLGLEPNCIWCYINYIFSFLFGGKTMGIIWSNL